MIRSDDFSRGFIRLFFWDAREPACLVNCRDSNRFCLFVCLLFRMEAPEGVAVPSRPIWRWRNETRASSIWNEARKPTGLPSPMPAVHQRPRGFTPGAPVPPTAQKRNCIRLIGDVKLSHRDARVLRREPLGGGGGDGPTGGWGRGSRTDGRTGGTGGRGG